MNIQLKNIIAAFIILFSTLSAQQIKSPHQIHNEKYGLPNIPMKEFNMQKADVLPLNAEVVSSLSKSVFGFYPDWQHNISAHINFQWDLLSHIACFDFVVSSDGSISLPPSWPWTEAIDSAHANGTKVVMTAVCFDRDVISSLVNNETNRNNFISNVITIISSSGLDGINIDFEGPYTSDRGTKMNNFVKAVTDSVHANFPESEVSFAAPAINWGGWDFPGLAAACDYIFVMSYGYYGSGSSTSGPNAPLTGGTYNLTNTYVSEYSSVPVNKIIMGVPYYGLHYTTAAENERASVTGFVGKPMFVNSQPQTETYGTLWSSYFKNSWYRYNNGGWNQVWFDNDSSLGIKYDLAILRNLKGVGMWALGFDGDRPELWNMLDYKFGSGQPPPPSKPNFLRVLIENSTTLRIQFENVYDAAGYKIVYGTDVSNLNDTLLAVSPDTTITGLLSDYPYFVKVAAVNNSGLSNFTEILAATPSDKTNNVLIVHGFDRGAGLWNTRDFIKNYSNEINNLGYAFASASNEALQYSYVDPAEYFAVVWILGDESTADETFNSNEQQAVINYLDQGGKFFVSGPEIGWDLGRSSFSTFNDMLFYSQYLKASYLKDAPQDQSSTYYSITPVTGSLFDGLPAMTFDNGTHGTYDVDWPDAINPANGAFGIMVYTGLSPAAAGYAGIAFEGTFLSGTEPGKLVYLSPPFETIYPDSVRSLLMAKIFEFFETPIGIKDHNGKLPESFVLEQNYPNPFNPVTRIRYSLPFDSDVTLTVHNVLGENISELVRGFKAAGSYEMTFNAQGLTSGIYFYIIEAKSKDGSKNFREAKKMILLK